MKSIGEWKAERAISEDDFSNYMANQKPEADGRLEMEFKPKVISVMDKFKSVPRGDLLNRLGVAISKAVAEIGGGAQEPNKEAGGFADMMGHEGTGQDVDLEREIKPKVERIMDMAEFKSMPKDELERALMAVAAKVINREGKQGEALPTSRHDDDPIAKESRFVPSFLRWAEQNEDQMGGLSEPQHKQGEASMDLKSVVEKRMMQLAMELEQDGKGSRREVLAAMKAVVDSAPAGKGQENNKTQDQAPAQGQAPEQGQGQAPVQGAGPQDSAAPPQGPVVS